MSVVLSFIFFISALPPISLPGSGLIFILPFLVLSSRNHTNRLLNSFMLSMGMASYLFYGIFSYHPGVFLLIVVLFTVAFGIFLIISSHLISAYPRCSIFIIPALWLMIELIINSFRIPLTMAMMSMPIEVLHPIASVGGHHLLGIFIVMTQILLANLWIRFVDKKKDILYLICGVIVLTISLTLYHPGVSDEDNNVVSVSLLQTNIHPHSSLSLAADNAIESLNQHRISLFEQALNHTKPDLVVFPEISVAHYEMLNIDNISNLAIKYKTSLLLASPHRTTDGKDHQSVFSIGENGNILHRSDKALLIPFLEKEFNTPKETSWTPHLLLPGKPGSLICFESVFSYPAIELSRNGAGFITITTNDAYAGPSILPMLHFEMARLRAIETGRTIVRAANAGISAVISPQGKVQQQLGLFKKGFINIQLQPIYQLTFYAKHYWQWQIIYWFIAMVSVFTLIFLPGRAYFAFPDFLLSYYTFAKLIGISAAILFQHFAIISLYELRTNQTIDNKLSTFQSNLSVVPYYTRLLADQHLSSIDAGLTYILRSHGNNITANQITMRHIGLEHQLRIPLILQDFRLIAKEIDFQRCTDRFSCLKNSTLVMLRHGEMVVIDDINDDYVMFFSPRYGRIMMIKAEAFSSHLTDQAWNITQLPIDKQI